MTGQRRPGAARQSWAAIRTPLITSHQDHDRFLARTTVAGLIPRQYGPDEHRMAAKLHELDEIRDAFVSSISHELRTPLTSILGFLHLVLNDGGRLSDADREHMLGLAQASSQELLVLVEDLLTLSQIEEGSIPLACGPVNLLEVLVAAMGSFTGSQMQRVGFEPAADHDVSIVADAAQLARAFVNILGNALKFTAENGSIQMDVVVEDHAVEVCVIDTGIGIPESEQGTLFSRFFRPSSHQDHEGMGVGLVVANGIIRGHGGSVDVESAVGTGTTVRIRLPRR